MTSVSWRKTLTHSNEKRNNPCIWPAMHLNISLCIQHCKTTQRGVSAGPDTTEQKPNIVNMLCNAVRSHRKKEDIWWVIIIDQTVLGVKH